MVIEIEALVGGVRMWREFANPTEARKWARGEMVWPLQIVAGGHAVSMGRFIVDAVIARWDNDAQAAITIEFPLD